MNQKNQERMEKMKARQRDETRKLLGPVVEFAGPYLDGVIQCGLGNWDEGPVLLELFPEAKFLAVEPIHRYCHEAWKNGFRGPIIQGVLWSETGKVFKIQDFRSKTSVLDKEKRRGVVEARSVTLDDAVKFAGYDPWKDIVLWMDCEGAELQILKGLSADLLSPHICVIVCEVKDKPRIEGWPNTKIVVEEIEKLGFFLAKRVGDNALFLKSSWKESWEAWAKSR